jgi:hypothetical protein
MCISGESGGNSGLNKSSPGYLLERYAENQFRCTEAGVRKVEFDNIPDVGGGGDDSYTLRGYLWEGGAWVLKRTIGPSTFATGNREHGYKAVIPAGGITWKWWPHDKWVPDTVTVLLNEGTICTDCTSSEIYLDPDFYWGKVSSISPATAAISRYYSFPSGYCMYEGHAGTCVYDLYDESYDCQDGVNRVRQVTVSMLFQVYLRPGREASYVVYADVPGGSTISQGSGDFSGAGLEWDRAGETINMTSDLTCADWPVVISGGGSIDVTIPPHGS